MQFICLPLAALGSGSSAQLPCLPWQRLCLSQSSSTSPSSSPSSSYGSASHSFAQSRIRSAALYAMHFSALLTLERALGQSGRDPSCTPSLCPCFCPCTPLPSTCYCCLQRLHCNAAASSARARFLAACMCDGVCVCASVVCLKGYVLHSSLYVCVFASTLPQAF